MRDDCQATASYRRRRRMTGLRYGRAAAVADSHFEPAIVDDPGDFESFARERIGMQDGIAYEFADNE